MFKKLLGVCFFVIFVSGGSGVINAQNQPAECCFDCTCSLCGDIISCYVVDELGNTSPFASLPEDCYKGGSEDCGINTSPVNLCSTYWQNNQSEVDGPLRSGDPPGVNVPDDCIPIDGGLGFLIAGGLGIGVMGIRRRKEELEVERD